jgi:DNA primase
VTKTTFQERAVRLKANLRLSDLIRRSVELRHSGSGFQGICPFHHEKTPSFTVNDQLGRFKCFGCGASGDAIDWIVQREGVSAARALDVLESGAGLSTGERVLERDGLRLGVSCLGEVV